eukprot:2614666-Pyramimonas_sp.AAC.1
MDIRRWPQCVAVDVASVVALFVGVPVGIVALVAGQIAQCLLRCLGNDVCGGAPWHSCNHAKHASLCLPESVC